MLFMYRGRPFPIQRLADALDELDQQRRHKLYQQEQRPDSACAKIVITEESLPGSFIYVASETEFKQHGYTGPTRTDEQQPPPVQLGDLLPQHEKRPGEEGTGGKGGADLVSAKLSDHGT